MIANSLARMWGAFMRLILVFALSLTIGAEVSTAQDGSYVGYVVSVKGSWKETRTNADIVAATGLGTKDGFRPAGTAGKDDSITVRFFPELCERSIHCANTPCVKPFLIEEIIASLPVTCLARQAGSWKSAISGAWTAFFSAEKKGQIALAMSVSRAAESDEDEGGPVLREAVLLVDAGRLDLGPLFRDNPSSALSLQFCDLGSGLMSDCTGSGEQDRTTVDATENKILPVAFTKPDGLYRVRLWKMTPRGAQPTERTAVALVGSRARFGESQREFQQIVAGAEDLSRTDPMIRNMLGAWLATRRAETVR